MESIKLILNGFGLYVISYFIIFIGMIIQNNIIIYIGLGSMIIGTILIIYVLKVRNIENNEYMKIKVN